MPIEQSMRDASVVRYHLVVFQGTGDGIDRGLFERIHGLLEENVSSKPGETEIDLWIDSPGGNPHAAYKIFLDLRHRCSRLRAVVPDYAKSAATLLMLGMDEIYMAPTAELGPLDAQIEHPDKEHKIVSALDIADSLDSLSETSIKLAQRYSNWLVQVLNLPRAEILDRVLEFMAQFMQPIVSKLDAHQIHQATNLLEVATQYGSRMLNARNVSEEKKIDIAGSQKLLDALVKDYSTHGFVISRDEAAKELGLPIRNAEDYPRWSNVLQLHKIFEEGGQSVVKIQKDADFEGANPNQETNHA